jgi:Zn-finger nucleic acid-binding protein
MSPAVYAPRDAQYNPAMALRCPRCRVDLAIEKRGHARFDRCPRCRGVAVNLALLRRFAPPERLRNLWLNLSAGRAADPCPSCDRPLLAAPVDCGGRDVEIEVCRPCQLLWFDAEKLAEFSPSRQAPAAPKHELSPAAAEALALAMNSAERLGDQAEDQAQFVANLLIGIARAIV